MTATQTAPPAPAAERTHPRWWAAALSGLVAGAVTVGLAELLAAVLTVTGLAGGQPSPVISVGDAFVDRTPGPLKDFAVRTFGENDKLVLLGSIGLVLVVLALAAGIAAGRRLVVGLGLVLLLGLVAVGAIMTRPSASPLDVVPTVIGTAAGLWTLRWLIERATPTTSDDGSAAGWSRRTFLGSAGAAGAAAVVAGGAGHVLESSLGSVEDSRAKVRLPKAAEPVTVPKDVQLPIKGITPWQTDPATFYRVDTALRLPQITTEEWSLKVHGKVGKELTIDYRTLVAKPLVERLITLTCVSNEVGGKLLGNAVWLGYPVKDLLADLEVDPGADMVLSTSQDGMTISTPLENLTKNRDALLAVAMNGEPLPVQHGFPVRMVVPGLYGYVSATKWVTDLKVTRFADDEAYWTPRGYSAKAPIKFSSRIDVPKGFAQLKAGKNAIAGVAWAQAVGVAKVQVRVDRGSWQDARLAGAPSKNTWVQWVYEWDAEPGSHTLECRLVDADGNEQVESKHGIRPDGSTGLDSKNVTVS
ncbi:molybdopterin-dependent oxidoreductase [Angustibacter luteus]|uniref:Molybdopterin-dependent oxidoreductase n=1 Tax=Angustibacter luteus TaxID=658456 RepID=A0ABW1JK60_9ACTN